MSTVPTAPPDDHSGVKTPVELFDGRTGTLELGELLREGSAAQLYEAVLHVDGEQIPVVAKVAHPNPKDAEWARREKQMYQSVEARRATTSLPHVIRCHGVTTRDSRLTFVLERAVGDAMAAHVTSTPERVELAWSVLVGALRGLVELRGVALVHRDLHPGNLLLTSAKPGPDDVRITDLNRASRPEAPPQNSDGVPTPNSIYGQGVVMPHDVIREGGVQPIDEAYSAAVSAYLMLTHGAPGGPALPLRDPERATALRYSEGTVAAWEKDRAFALATEIDLSSLDLPGVRTYVAADGTPRGERLAEGLSALLVADRDERRESLEHLQTILDVRGLVSLAVDLSPEPEYVDVARPPKQPPKPEVVPERTVFPLYLATRKNYRPMKQKTEQKEEPADTRRWSEHGLGLAFFTLLAVVGFLALPTAAVGLLIRFTPGWLRSAAPEIAVPVSQWGWTHWGPIALVAVTVALIQAAFLAGRKAALVTVAVLALVTAVLVPVLSVTFWPRPEPALELADTTMRPIADCPDGVVPFTHDVAGVCWTAPGWEVSTASAWVEGAYPFDNDWGDPSSPVPVSRVWVALTDTQNPCQQVYAMVGQMDSQAVLPADLRLEPHNGQVYSVDTEALDESGATGTLSYVRRVVHRDLLKAWVTPATIGQTGVFVLVQRTECQMGDVPAADASVEELLDGIEVRDLTQLDAFTVPRVGAGTGRLGPWALAVPVATDLLPWRVDSPSGEGVLAGVGVVFPDENDDVSDNPVAWVEVVDAASVPAEATTAVDSDSGQWLTTNTPVAAEWSTNGTKMTGTAVDYYRMAVDSTQTPVMLRVRVYTGPSNVNPGTLQAFLDRVSLRDPSAPQEA